MQPVSCTIERTIELPAPPDEVWDALPELFSDDDRRRVRVIDESDPPHRLAFWWTMTEGNEAPSYVEIDLDASAAGTLLHVRETRLDGAHLVHSAFNALTHAS
jgi:uncharacterized protein YndB with AHSA1/START domain